MKKRIIALFLFMILASCRENIVESVDSTTASNIYIQTIPSGAEIYFKGDRTYKHTPDSLSNLSPGIYAVKLKLVGYADAQFNIYLSKGEKHYINYSFNND